MKIIKVESCRECPYLHYEYTSKRWVCLRSAIGVDKTPRRITNLNEIADFCPLEDSDE